MHADFSRRFHARSRQALDSRESVKPRIKAQDSLDSVVFHDGQMHGITRRYLSMPHDNFLCALCCGQINGQHLIGNAEQSVERRLDQVTFSLAFVTTPDEIGALAPKLALKAEGDAIVWFAYPKRTSKRYKSRIDRDNGWNVLGHEGFEPVRMVAIDEDWSAKRFRRASFIKNMRRPKNYRLTERGKVQRSKAPHGSPRG